MILTTATKEDANRLLEETWDVDYDDPFFKIISKETKKSVIKPKFRNSPTDSAIAPAN